MVDPLVPARVPVPVSEDASDSSEWETLDSEPEDCRDEDWTTPSNQHPSSLQRGKCYRESPIFESPPLTRARSRRLHLSAVPPADSPH